MDIPRLMIPLPPDQRRILTLDKGRQLPASESSRHLAKTTAQPLFQNESKKARLLYRAGLQTREKSAFSRVNASTGSAQFPRPIPCSLLHQSGKKPTQNHADQTDYECRQENSDHVFEETAFQTQRTAQPDRDQQHQSIDHQRKQTQGDNANRQS